MSKERIESGENAQLTIHCHGDLKIRGWAEPVISVNANSYQTTEDKAGYTIRGDSDLSLMVPVGTTLNVAKAHGDLAIKNMTGDVTLSEVMGDVVLRNMGQVNLFKVYADVAARNLDGSFSAGEVLGDLVLRNVQELKVDRVHGDFAARYINGNTFIGSVMGDILLSTVSGDVSIVEGHRDANLSNLGGVNAVTSAHGDIRLRGGLAAGKHTLSADGDIVVRWPAGSPVRLEATASSIKNLLDLENIVEDKNSFSGHMGDGKTYLNLEAKGSIVLKDLASTKDPWKQFEDGDSDWSVDLNGLGEHIATEINERMGEWSTQMEKRLGPDFMAKIEQKTREAAQRAEQAAEKAVRKAEKAAKKIQWRMDRRTARSQRRAKKPSSAESNKATEEEQLKILRMVEKGIITPDEAGTLLEAMEG